MKAGMEVAGIEALIDVTMGKKPADLVVANGKLVNVHTGEIFDCQSVQVIDDSYMEGVLRF